MLGYHYSTQWGDPGYLPCVFWAVDRNGPYENPVGGDIVKGILVNPVEIINSNEGVRNFLCEGEGEGVGRVSITFYIVILALLSCLRDSAM